MDRTGSFGLHGVRHCHSHPVNHSNGIWTGLAPLHEIQRTLTACRHPLPSRSQKNAHHRFTATMLAPSFGGRGHGMLDHPV